jgi:hypothetical protein
MNLFVAFGNLKVINRMMSYTVNYKVLLSQTFYSSDGSCAEVEKYFVENFLSILDRRR